MVSVSGFFLYLGTNIDNALILLACLGGRPDARRNAALSILFAALAVLAFGIALTELIDDLGGLRLNLLGLVPLGLGLLALWRGPDDPAEMAKPVVGLTAATLLLLSNSADTFATMVAYLAERPDAVRIPFALGYTAGVAVLVSGIVWLLGRLESQSVFAKWGSRIGPLIMIGFGLFILLDTAGDKL